MSDFDPEKIPLTVVFNGKGGGVRCVYLDDFRIVGSKPYDSEHLKQQDFETNLEDLQRGFVTRLCLTPAAQPIATAKKDGKLVILWIAADDARKNPLEDSAELTPSIGFNNYDNDGVDEWKFAGWCWSHDVFVEGKGRPVAWQPFPFNEGDRRAASLAQES